MKQLNFEYERAEIPFRVDGNGEVFMNATEMAKPFGRSKRVSNFLRSKDILEYINALHESKSLSHIRDIKKSPLISIETRKSGTWMQENIALRFAQRLGPKFGIWCDERIKEIRNKGFFNIDGYA